MRQALRHGCPHPSPSPDPRGPRPLCLGPPGNNRPRVIQNQAQSHASLSLHPPPLSPPTRSQKGDARGGVCPDRGVWPCCSPSPPPPSHLSALGSLSTHKITPPRLSPPLGRASFPGSTQGQGVGRGPAWALQGGHWAENLKPQQRQLVHRRPVWPPQARSGMAAPPQREASVCDTRARHAAPRLHRARGCARKLRPGSRGAPGSPRAHPL